MNVVSRPARAIQATVLLVAALCAPGCGGKEGSGAGSDASTSGGGSSGGGSSSSGAESSGGSDGSSGGSGSGSSGSSSSSGSGSGGSSGGSSGGGSGSGGGGEAGSLACGPYSCDVATEFCYEAGGGAFLLDGGSNFTYACNPIPAQCQPNPTCACIIAADAGTHGCPCSVQAGGALRAECLYP